MVLSSVVYKRGRMNWDDIMQEKKYDTLGAYSASKLANVLFCTELSKRLEGRSLRLLLSNVLNHILKFYLFSS